MCGRAIAHTWIRVVFRKYLHWENADSYSHENINQLTTLTCPLRSHNPLDPFKYIISFHSNRFRLLSPLNLNLIVNKFMFQKFPVCYFCDRVLTFNRKVLRKARNSRAVLAITIAKVR